MQQLCGKGGRGEVWVRAEAALLAVALADGLTIAQDDQPEPRLTTAEVNPILFGVEA
jgi:hypothetical protein